MNETLIILAVDRNQRNLELLAQFLGKEGYQVLKANSLEEFHQSLTNLQDIDLAMVDIAGFDRRIWDYCQRLRDQKVPFFVLSPKQSTALQNESLARGARSVLVKPLVVKELLGIIHSLLGE
ncbi:MAG TPA: response regulator [Coleofasciculaceae cyanobacterium]